MPRYFVDSSALAKVYHVETGTAKMLAMLAETGSAFFISALTVIEIQSVGVSGRCLLSNFGPAPL
jgi:PIN domain nuclease of toxin-antitoxin system